MKVCLNSLGVTLATIGAFLVWYFIGQLNFADRDTFLKGNGKLIVPTVTTEMIKKLRIEMLLSKLGLALIVIGGILQIASNYID
jgi:hypothetical protein